VPGRRRLVAEALADDPEIGVQVALAPPVALGDAGCQRGIHQLAGALVVTVDGVRQPEHPSRARLTDWLTLVTMDALCRLGPPAPGLDAPSEHIGQPKERHGPAPQPVLPDFRGQLRRLGQDGLGDVERAVLEADDTGGDLDHDAIPVALGASLEELDG
jgi:hypothetical protein